MMTRLLLLFVSAVTLFAQRTPLKVNGSVVNNPNFINSPSLTWTIVGQDITGTAAGGPGGDTIWTNDNGTISASSTAGNGTNAFQVNAATTHASGNLVVVQNNGTNVLNVLPQGALRLGPDAVLDTSDNVLLYGVRTSSGGTAKFRSNDAADNNWANAFASFAGGTGDGGTNSSSGFQVEVGNANNDYGYALLQSIVGESVDSSGLWIGGAADYVKLLPFKADGQTPFYLDTREAHTTGNLLEVKNNGTNKVQITTYGGLLLANGPDNGSDTDTLSNTYDLSKGDPDVTSINTYLVDSDGFNYYAQAILNMSITSSNAPTVSLNLGATPGDTGNESHINIRIAPAGTTDGSISTRVGSGAENISLYPNVNDGASPFTLFCEQVHTTGNLFELGNTSTNYIQVPVDQASTNAPLILLINGTQKRVHVGAPDSGGTGLRALAIEN